MRVAIRISLIVMGSLLMFAHLAQTYDEPKGLIFRKGLVTWRASLGQARQFIEEEIGWKRPYVPPLVKRQGEEEKEPKVEKFRCSKEKNTSLVTCQLACCVELGEKNVVHFADLWFHKDRFYGYKLTFNTDYFDNLAASLEKRFGKPTKEGQETIVNRNPLAWRYGAGSFVAQTKQWEMSTTRVVLSDRGGNGAIRTGYLLVVYLPVSKERNEERKQAQPDAKVPF